MAARTFETPSYPRTATTNVALQDCDITCVPEFKKDSNTRVVKKCDSSMVDPRKCHLETKDEEKFYKAVNWEVLMKYIDIYMGYFIEELNQNSDLARLIQSVYKFGPVPDPPGAIIQRFGRIGFRILRNENFTFCGNIIIKITLSSKSREQELSHISLHPLLPLYYRDTRRSRSGCGYYKRLEQKNETYNPDDSDEGGSGPFHYKIDTLYWKQPRFQYGKDVAPSVQYELDPKNQGLFLVPKTNFRNVIKQHDIVLESDEKPYAEDFLKQTAGEAKKQTVQFFRSQGKSIDGKGDKKLQMSEFSLKQKTILNSLIDRAIAEGKNIYDPEAKGSSTKVLEEHIENLNLLHSFIANDFIRFWNTKMIKGLVEPPSEKRAGYTGFPSVLRLNNASRPVGAGATGGRRKTRRGGNKRHRTRKH